MASILYFIATFSFIAWLVWTLALSEYLEIEREHSKAKPSKKVR